MQETGSVPGWRRSPGERNGNSLQYSCLGNPMDRGAWWSTVHRMAKESDTTEWQTTTVITSQCCVRFCGPTVWVSDLYPHIPPSPASLLSRLTPLLSVITELSGELPALCSSFPLGVYATLTCPAHSLISQLFVPFLWLTHQSLCQYHTVVL